MSSAVSSCMLWTTNAIQEQTKAQEQMLCLLMKAQERMLCLLMHPSTSGMHSAARHLGLVHFMKLAYEYMSPKDQCCSPASARHAKRQPKGRLWQTLLVLSLHHLA